MSKFPRITLITPSFNQGQYLEQTILSVLEQKYPDLEYFIFDGGSKDNSVEIIRKYEKYLAGWTSGKDRGQSHAINKGLEKMTGLIFNWINSDDRLAPGALHKVAEEFKNPQTTIVTGTTRLINNKSGEEKDFVTVKFDSLAKTIARPFFFQPSTFLLSKFIKRTGFLTDSLHYAMDTELYTKYLMLSGHEGIVVLPDTLSYYLIHEASKTGSQADKFESEIKTIFYTLAANSGLESQAESIAACSEDSIKEGYELIFQDGFTPDKALVESISANYIYKNIVLMYGTTQPSIPKLRQLFRALDLHSLEPLDQKVAKKIQNRVTFAPFMHKLRQMLKR